VGDKILLKTIDTIDGLEHLCGLVLMKQTGACTSCLLYKGKVTGHPKANVHRLEAAGRWVQWDRMDINLNGLQKVKSAGHNQYFIIGVSPQKLRIITGVTYLSQILFVMKLLFVEAG